MFGPSDKLNIVESPPEVYPSNAASKILTSKTPSNKSTNVERCIPVSDRESQVIDEVTPGESEEKSNICKVQLQGDIKDS